MNKPVIKIVSVPGAEAPAAAQPFAAGIDTNIFEADSQALDGERFWEAYWQTQHTYGGISEGQPLAAVLGALDAALFDKLQGDVRRLAAGDDTLPEAEGNDILGMVIFLLCMERADPSYNPLAEEGYEKLMMRFVAAVDAESARRASSASPN